MLEIHFGLNRRPFVNRGILYKSYDYQELNARFNLVYQYEGICLITGHSGTGKTYVTNALLSRLSNDYKVAKIHATSENPFNLLKTIGETLGEQIKGLNSSGYAVANKVATMIKNLHEKRIKVILLIDEADALDMDAYVMLDRLHNKLSVEGVPLITIFLGNETTLNHFNSKINPLKGRLLLNYQMVGPQNIIREYCESEIETCGGKNLVEESCWEILRNNVGNSFKLINTIMFNALNLAYFRNERTITASTLLDTLRDLGL